MARDWNQAYDSGDTPWDKGRAAPPLQAFLQTHSIDGRVLVPGCGIGHDVRLLSAQGAEVTGLDLAPLAIKKAQEHPCAGSERYLEGDFLDLPEALKGAFDWVVEHTCLCALDPADRALYAHSVLAALRPGGYYLAIFYRHIEADDGEGPPYPITASEIEALFDSRFETLESFVPSEHYESRPIGSEEVRLMQACRAHEAG